MSSSEKPQKNYLSDPSLWFLLFSNLATMVLAFTQGWSLNAIMWVYWFQSVTIGFFNFLRMRNLTEFSTEGVRMNGQAVEPTASTKNSAAYFFLLHYGIFHAVYAVFLTTGIFVAFGGSEGAGFSGSYVLPAAAMFFLNHWYSYNYNKPRDTKHQNIGNLLFYPYIRIIPMHITIIAGSFLGGAIFFFLFLKTIADLAMHIVEHRVLRKGESDDTYVSTGGEPLPLP